MKNLTSEELTTIAEAYINGNISDFKVACKVISKTDIINLAIIFQEVFNYDLKEALLRIKKFAFE